MIFPRKHNALDIGSKVKIYGNQDTSIVTSTAMSVSMRKIINGSVSHPPTAYIIYGITNNLVLRDKGRFRRPCHILLLLNPKYLSYFLNKKHTQPLVLMAFLAICSETPPVPSPVISPISFAFLLVNKRFQHPGSFHT